MSGASASGQQLRPMRRIVIVAAAVSALVAGAVSVAARAGASQPVAPHVTDRLAEFEASGCRQLVAVPKAGWMCINP